MPVCKCGCGEKVRGKHDFVDEMHLARYIANHEDVPKNDDKPGISLVESGSFQTVYNHENSDAIAHEGTLIIQNGTIPRSNPSRRCFVIMPSGNHGEYNDGIRESDFIFNDIIIPAVSHVYGQDIEVIREADANAAGAIDRRIVEHVSNSDISIVDITGQNPNVFFELGMRYALRKNTTILLRQASTQVPFDIHSYRCVVYDPKWDGAEYARRDIAASLAVAKKAGVNVVDSLVYNVYPDMQILFNENSNARGHELDKMSWDEYWKQITMLQDLLAGPVTDGMYKPQVIVGMSNGGMIVADLIGRNPFKGNVPITSFWVNRWHDTADWFNNPINYSFVEAIKTYAPKTGSVELLLVDDIVASGKTYKEAINFLANNLGNVNIKFLPVFSANQDYIRIVKDVMIWKHSAFNHIRSQTKYNFDDIHITSYRKLPYDKDIRSS